MYKISAVIAAIVWIALPANGQSQIFETCSSSSACANAADDSTQQARSLLSQNRFRDAAQFLYPLLEADNANIPVGPRIDASTTLAQILAEAELYGYAALEAGTANRMTGAPSSAGLLNEARLYNLAGLEEEALRAYQNAETLATTSANLDTMDALISDYQTMGRTSRAANASAARRNMVGQFETACAEAQCRTNDVVPARVQERASASYPDEAVRRNLSGTCRVTLNVTEAGQAEDIKAECSDPAFTASARDAASRTRFSPRFRSGAPEPEYGVVLPVEFALD